MIHPQSFISPDAFVGRQVRIGPFCVVEAGASIGDGCRLGSHVVVKPQTVLGANNEVGEYAVLGGLPQHAHPPERFGSLVIGGGNRIREFCTLHRSLFEGQATVVGDGNLLMVGVHIGHDCKVGSGAILTNNTLLGGHVEVEDRAYLSGAVAVHQFCRIGRLAMVGGHARVKKDIPPFVLAADGSGAIVGLNTIGLRRAGFSEEDRRQLKAAYRLIYRRGLPWAEVLAALQEEFPTGPAAEFHRFLSGGRRGFAQERRLPPGVTLRIHQELEQDDAADSDADIEGTYEQRRRRAG